tara:strand:+ start:5062 stop:6978 length:1917 start_codon:yes stop_codon:yes gene_type:complete
LGRANSSLLGFEILNPDETQMMANAVGIVSRNYDIAFFDGNSSGLINSLVLTLPKIFNFDISFFSTRLTAIILISLIILCSYKISRNYLSQKLSFLLCLPLILFFGFTKDPDFLHYSSELVSTLILIFSYLMYLQYQKGKNFFFYIPCLLLSLIFFSKIQFGPSALLLFFIILFESLLQTKSKKNIILLILIFVLLPVSLLSFYYLSNTLNDFFINYIQYPKDYITVMNSVDTTTVFNNLENKNLKIDNNYLGHLVYNSALHYFYIYFLLFIIILAKYLNKDFIKIFLQKNLLINLIFIISIVVCILIPGRNFRHYLISLMPFVPIFFSILVSNILKKNKLEEKKMNYLFILLISIFSLSLLTENKKFYSKKFTHTKFKWEDIYIKNPEMFSFLKVSKKDKMFIWGWMPKWYVLSGFQPVSRSTISEKLIEENNYKNYYRKRLIKDIKLNQPNLIIDFVRPKSFKHILEKDKIENFDNLNKIVKNDYTKIKSINKNCPTYYLLNKNFESFNKNNINFLFEKNKFFKMNDFSITEDVCDDKYSFSLNDDNEFLIIFDQKDIVKNINILSSKMNTSKNYIIIKFLENKKVVERKKIYLKKYPYWTKVILNKQITADSILFDIENLKLTKSGINEIKIFRN